MVVILSFGMTTLLLLDRNTGTFENETKKIVTMMEMGGQES
jgi:hypothetical protein